MNKTDDRLIEWAINETIANYKDEVSILLEHNTYSLEEDRSVRYVNTIISDSKKHIGLARTFIINGIGYDFNQVSWESFERDAELKGWYPTVLAEANILYAKNESDKQRFLYLRAKLRANLANEQYMFNRGLECLSDAMDIYKTLMFEDSLKNARKGVVGIIHSLTTAVACYNQTYYSSYTKIDELKAMKNIPENFITLYNHVVAAKSVSEIKSSCYDFILTTRSFFKANDKRRIDNKVIPNYENLAEWYQECSYYFRRLYHFCENKNADLTLDICTGLQTDLDECAKEFGLPVFDMLSSFDADDLPVFAKVVKEVEDCILSVLKTNNVKLDSYTSVEEFIAQNT